MLWRSGITKSHDAAVVAQAGPTISGDVLSIVVAQTNGGRSPGARPGRWPASRSVCRTQRRDDGRLDGGLSARLLKRGGSEVHSFSNGDADSGSSGVDKSLESPTIIWAKGD
jgi:hypothetical protein